MSSRSSAHSMSSRLNSTAEVRELLPRHRRGRWQRFADGGGASSLSRAPWERAGVRVFFQRLPRCPATCLQKHQAPCHQGEDTGPGFRVMRAHARTRAGGTTHRPEQSSRPVKGGAEDPPGEPRPDEPAPTLQITPPAHHPHDPRRRQIAPAAGLSVCPHPLSPPALARILLHSQTFAPFHHPTPPRRLHHLMSPVRTQEHSP